MNDREQQQHNAEHIAEVVSEVANALQAAAPLAGRLRVTAAQQHEDAETLKGAIGRAVRALRRLRPEGGPR